MEHVHKFFAVASTIIYTQINIINIIVLIQYIHVSMHIYLTIKICHYEKSSIPVYRVGQLTWNRY